MISMLSYVLIGGFLGLAGLIPNKVFESTLPVIAWIPISLLTALLVKIYFKKKFPELYKEPDF